MSWSDRITTSWDLLQRSWQVIRSNPKLLLFPLVSTVCAIAVVLFFLLPVAAISLALDGFHSGKWAELARHWNHATAYVFWVVMYLGSMFVATFFNVALYEQIFRALAGDPVSLRAGLRFAVTKIRAILLWSLLAGTVGLAIRAVEERLGWVGRIAMGLVGIGWSIAAVFAIPVIIRRDNSNPLAVLRDSAATLKRTWGESLIGFVGIRLAGAVIVAAAIVFGALTAIVTGFALDAWIAIVGGGICVVAFVIALFFMSIATHVYRCALYIYASEGVVPGPFTTEMMHAAWKVKKS
jgi:hypothetical protein